MTRSAVILYNAVEANASAADADVLVQVRVVREALEQLGWQVRELPATLDLSRIACELTDDRPDFVFNLVESLGGLDWLASLIPELLEGLYIPFTGSRSDALRLSNDKLKTKRTLTAAKLPTPGWIPGGLSGDSDHWILKPIFEHASIGMDDSAIVFAKPYDVYSKIDERRRAQRIPIFAEAFIRGREFNLSLLDRGGECVVLPPAEIIFQGFPPEKPRIVGYAAKWDANSFEFQHTPRTFDFPESDAALLEKLKMLAVKCWRKCGLAGYARVDFRVDEQGQPWILEINANPCLSPDGGFAAALANAGIPFVIAVQAIVEGAAKGSTRQYLRQDLNQIARELETEMAEAKSLDDARGYRLRYIAQPEDITAVECIVASTGMFRPAEVDVAAELVETRLEDGPNSGYEFVFVEVEGRTVGYVCFGRNTLTVSSYDLYWIAVENEQRGQGLGSVLLQEVERLVTEQVGTRIYIETSHRPDYEPTRKFYEKHGYVLQAMLPDFYAPGDGRAIFVKALSAP